MEEACSLTMFACELFETRKYEEVLIWLLNNLIFIILYVQCKRYWISQ